MEECFVCGVSGEKARLFDAIHPEGIKKICEKCSREEDFMIIRRPTTFQLKEAERPRPPRRSLQSSPQFSIDSKKEEVSLRQIVDMNYKSKASENKRPRPDLIDNFHWVIMMARRSKKITQEQLAQDVQESVAAIKMAEQGILPEDDHKLINKLENSLGIKLIRKDFKGNSENVSKQPVRILGFNKDEVDNLTISDLKDMKKRKEGVVPEMFEEDDSDLDDFEEDIEVESEVKKSKGWFS